MWQQRDNGPGVEAIHHKDGVANLGHEIKRDNSRCVHN